MKFSMMRQENGDLLTQVTALQKLMSWGCLTGFF